MSRLSFPHRLEQVVFVLRAAGARSAASDVCQVFFASTASISELSRCTSHRSKKAVIEPVFVFRGPYLVVAFTIVPCTL